MVKNQSGLDTYGFNPRQTYPFRLRQQKYNLFFIHPKIFQLYFCKNRRFCHFLLNNIKKRPADNLRGAPLTDVVTINCDYLSLEVFDN